MSEFDQRIIEIVENYKKGKMEGDINTAHSNAVLANNPDIEIETLADSLSYPEAKEITSAVIEEYNADKVVRIRHDKDGKTKIEGNSNFQTVHNMVKMSLFLCDCSFEHLKEGNTLAEVAKTFEKCRAELSEHKNAMHLQDDKLHISIINSLIDLCNQKANSSNGNIKFLAKEIAEQVFNAFNEMGISTAHVKPKGSPSSPFAVFETICKRYFEDYILQHKDAFKYEYQNLDGWEQAIRDVKAANK